MGLQNSGICLERGRERIWLTTAKWANSWVQALAFVTTTISMHHCELLKVSSRQQLSSPRRKGNSCSAPGVWGSPQRTQAAEGRTLLRAFSLLEFSSPSSRTSRKQKSRFAALGFCNQSKPTSTKILPYLKIIQKNKCIWQLAIALSTVLLV